MSTAPAQHATQTPGTDPFTNNFNSLELVGRIGVVPEVKLTKKSPVTNTLLYVTNMYEGEQGRVKKVTRVPLILFGQRGQEFAQQIGKGDVIRVRGRIQENIWKDHETQQNRSRLELVVLEYEPLHSKARQAAA
jgi:single-stranded DNA-binding protein